VQSEEAFERSDRELRACDKARTLACLMALAQPPR
jgi:hypothetical protein